MIIKKKLSKDAINALPLRYYEGSITLIDSFKNADKACDKLAHETILGFDTETKPSFKKVVAAIGDRELVNALSTFEREVS